MNGKWSFRIVVIMSFLISSAGCSSSIEPSHHSSSTPIEAESEYKEQIIVPIEIKSKPFPGIIPLEISIPAVHIHAMVEPLTNIRNGQMGAPTNVDRVGYLASGILPGAVGNAIMDGHVDSYTGPAAFYSLKKLKKGDIVYVTGAHGCEVQFIVESVNYYLTAEAPINTIFGPSNEHRLNLITCAGRYSRSRHEHEGRLVVFTKLYQTNAKCKNTHVNENNLFRDPSSPLKGE